MDTADLSFALFSAAENMKKKHLKGSMANLVLYINTNIVCVSWNS